MIEQVQVRACVWHALAAVLGSRLPPDADGQFPLLESRLLSSLDVARVLVEIEEALARDGVTVVLGDIEEWSPLKTIDMLVAYVAAQCRPCR